MSNSQTLQTFKGFYAEAERLLKEKGNGFALVDMDTDLFFVLDGREVCCLTLKTGDSLLAPKMKYSLDDSVCLDPRAWGDDCWSGSTVEATQAMLLSPQFVELSLTNVLEHENSERSMEHAALGVAPQMHEYGFDVMLKASIRVKASSPEQAIQMLHSILDSADCNAGAWPNGDPVLFEASTAEDTGPMLFSIDGEEVAQDVDSSPSPSM